MCILIKDSEELNERNIINEHETTIVIIHEMYNNRICIGSAGMCIR